LYGANILCFNIDLRKNMISKMNRRLLHNHLP
jgi:hypothetical protein